MNEGRYKMFSNRRRNLKRKRMIAAGLFITTVLLLFLGIYWFQKERLPIILIKVEDASIYPDEALPEFEVKASADNATKKIVLDAKEDYTVQDFLDMINAGEGYKIACKFDAADAKEGDYEIKVVLTGGFEQKISVDWKKIIQVKLESGTLMVKNQLGEWDGDKFVLRDGTYVSSRFIRLGEDTYYFDEEGNKVSGEQEIWGKIYYFGKDGKFDEEKNDINPTLPMIALTFDDGPSKYTEKLLDALERYDARATFFMVGNNVKKRPEVVARMKEIGCEIGNHTTDHKRLTELNKAGIVAQVEGTNDAIRDVIGEGATVVRPPYGAANDLVKKTVEQPLVLWNVDTLDWKTKDAEKVKDYTLDIVKDGDIVLMHDLYESTIDATIAMIPELQERGYQLVTVSEMAQAHGIDMESGEKYYSFK